MPTDWATIARDMERRSTPPTPGGQDDGTGGLVIPGANRPYQTPPRERGLNEMIGGLGGMALEASDIVPRYAAWNLGPMLVGRNGQGPLNGADALRGAGILQGSHGQRAMAAGLGAGLDFLGQPMMLGGVGAGRAASANPVTARLARMVAPVNESNAAGRQVMQARIDNWMQGVGNPGRDFVTGAPRPGFAGGLGVDADLARRHAGGLGRDPGPLARPPAVLADTVPGGGAVATPGRMGRAVPGMRGYVDPAGYGYDAAALRSFQLNHPSFNPAEPAFGLGTGQFTQDAGQAARHGLSEYNPLTTAGSQPTASANPLTAQLQQLAGTPPSRFDRMIPARPLPQIPSQAAAEASANLAATLRRGQSPSSRAVTISPNRQGTLADVLRTAELPRIPAAPPNLGPPVPLAPATSGTPAPFATGANQPPELGGLNLRAAWEAMRNTGGPGRGETLGQRLQTIVQPPPGTDPFMTSLRPPYRPPTLPNGPIDY